MQSFAKNNTVTALFLVSKNDTFVNYHHTKDILKDYKGKNEVYLIAEGHHESRN